MSEDAWRLLCCLNETGAMWSRQIDRRILFELTDARLAELQGHYLVTTRKGQQEYKVIN